MTTSTLTLSAGLLERSRRTLSAHALLDAHRELYVRRGRRALLVRQFCCGVRTVRTWDAAAKLPALLRKSGRV